MIVFTAATPAGEPELLHVVVWLAEQELTQEGQVEGVGRLFHEYDFV